MQKKANPAALLPILEFLLLYLGLGLIFEYCLLYTSPSPRDCS